MCDFLWLIETFILLCIISKLLKIIGQIFIFVLDSLVRGEPINTGPRNLASTNLETLLYFRVQNAFRYLEPFNHVRRAATSPALGHRGTCPPHRLRTISFLVHFGVSVTANYPSIV